jgi:hypothetical protein
MNYDKVVNCIWVTVIVITTVGYGDYFPRTLLGRGILTLGAFWGSFVVSLLVLVLTNSIKSKKIIKIYYINKKKKNTLFKKKIINLKIIYRIIT